MKTLRHGDKGLDVSYWQGFLGITRDGWFGKVTECKTIAWQMAQGLTPDGVVGPACWGKTKWATPMEKP